MKKNEDFSGLLFGDEGLFSNETKEKLKKAVPAMGVGGVIGGLTLGPSMGLLGSAAIGAASGFITTTNTFKDLVLGKEVESKDENGNTVKKREGGLLGALKKITLDPVITGAKAITSDIKDFVKKDVLEPLKSAVKPVRNMFLNMFNGIKDGIVHHVNNWFEEKLGTPMHEWFEDKILHPVTKWVKRLLFLPVNLANGIISAPFKLIGGIGNNLRANQIKAGKDLDSTAEERLLFRDKHKFRTKKIFGLPGMLSGNTDGYREFDTNLANASDEEVAALLRSSIALKNYGHDKSRVIANKNEEIAQYVDKYFDDKNRKGFNILFSKNSNVRKQILTAIKENKPEEVRRIVSKLKSRTGKKLSDADLTEFMDGLKNPMDEIADIKATGVMTEKEKIEAERALSRYGFHKNAFGRYNFDQLNRLLEAEKKGREKNGTWSLTPDAEAQVDATTEGVNKIVSQLSDMTTVITNAIAMAAEGKSIIDQDWMKKDYNGKLDERQIKLRNSLLGEKDHNKTMRKSDMDILRNSLDNKKKNWSAELDKAEINSHKKHDRRVDKISNIADNNGNHFVRDIDFSEANLNDKQLLKKLKKLAKQKYITKEAFELIGNEASPAGLKRVLDVIEAGYLMNEGFAKWLIDDSHNHEYKNKVKPVIKALKELSGPMKQKFISGLNLAVEKTRKRFINNWKPMRGMNLKQSIANYIDGLKSGVGNDFFDLTDKTKSGNEFTINRVTKKVKRHAYNKKANDHSGEDAKTEKVDTAAYGMDNTYSNRDIKAVVSRGELIGTDYDFSTILDQNDIPMFARGHRFRRKFDFDKSFEASIYYEKYLEAIDGWRAAHPDKSYHEYVQKEKEFRKKFQDMYDKAAKLSKSKSFYDYDADDENEAGLAFYERKAKYNKDKNKVDKIDLYRYGEEKTIDNLFKGNEAFNGKKLSNKKYSMAIEKIRQYNQFGDILKDKNASKEEKENAKENQTSILKDIRTYISTNVTDDGETLKKLIDKNGKVYVDKHDHENKEALKEGEVNNKSLNVLDKIREGIGNIKGWMTDPVTADGESRLSIAGKYLKKIALAVVGGIAAVGGIAGITKLLSKNTYNSLKSWWSETAAPTLSNTWETSIKPFLTDTLPTKLGEVVTTVSDKASEVITNAASWINENISTIGTALGEGIVTTTQFIGKLLPYVASGAWNALKAATGTNDRSKTNLEGNIVKSSLKAMANGSSGDLLKKATVKLPTIAGKIISPAVNASTTVAGSIIGAGGKAVTSAQRAIASSTLEKGGAEVIKDGAPYIIKNTSTGVYKATNRAIKELGEDGAKDLAKTATRNGSVSVTKSMLEDAATGGTKLATNTIKKTVGKNAAKTAEKEGVEAVLKTVSKSTQKELVQNVVQKSSVNISEDAVAAATKKLSNGAIAGKIAAAVNVWAKKAEKWFAAKIGAKNTTKLLKQVTTTTLWEKVLKKAGETVSGLATKLSASIATGGTLQLVFSTYDLIYPWLSDANTQQILGISTTPTILQKAIASLINVIANAPFCAYGLIPAEAFSWVLFDVVLPALDIDLGGISSARTESNSIVSAFNESMGTNLTVDEYNYLVNGKTTTGIFDNIYRATQGGKEGILKKINESAGTNYTLEDFEDWKNGTAYTVNSDGTVTVNSSNTDDSTDGSYVTADGVEGVASLGILSSIDNTLKTIVAYFTGESSDLDPDDYETVGSTNSQFLQDMENTYGIEAKYLSSDGYYTTTGSGSGRYSQRDNSINMRYNKATDTIYQDIKSSGCGPIAATNLINRNIKYGTGMIDPQDAANYALNKGYKETNGGTDPKYFTDYFAKNGIESTITSDRGLMKKAIKNGQQVVLMGQDKKYGMGGGTTPYGPNPHYVVATGMKGSNVVVDNPEEFDEYNLYDANNTINKSTTAIITNSKYGMGTDLWEKLPDDYVDKSNSSTTKTSTSSLKSAEAMQAISAHDTDKGSTGITYHSKYIDNAKYKDNEALKTKIDSLGDVTYDDISNTNTGYSLSYGNSILLSDLKSSYYNKNKNMLNSIDNKPEFNNGMSEKDFITVIAEYFSGKNVNEIVDPSDDDSTTNKKWYESALNSDFLKNIDIPSLVNYINSDVRTVPNFYKNTDNGDDFNSVAHLPSTYTIEPIYSLPLIYPAFAKGIAHTGDLYKYTDYGSEIMFAALKQAYKNANNAIFNKIINLNEYKTDSDLYNEKIKNSMKGILKYLYNGGQGEYSSFLANYYNLKNDYNDELESKYIETSEFPYLLSELFSPSFMTLSRLGDANTSITNDNSTYNKARFDMATGSTYELGESKSGSLLKNLFGSDASSFPDVLTPKMFKEIMSNAILNKNSLTDEELLINKIRKELKSINIPFESDTYPTFADYTSSGNLNIARAYIKHLKGLDEYIKASPSLKSLGNYTETEDGNTIDFGLTKMLDYWKDDIANIEDFPDYYGIDETGIPRVTNKSEEQLASTYYAKLFKKDPDEILTSDIQSAAKYNMDNIYNNNLEVINHTTKTLFGDATYKRTWKSNKPVLSVVGHNFTPSDIDYLSSIKDIITGENIKYTIGQKTYDDFYSAISSNGASDKNSVMSPYYDFVVLATALENAKKSNDYTSFTNISTPATGFFTDTAFQNPVFPSIYGTGDNISDINGYNYKNEIYSKSGYYNDRSVEDIIETFHNELLNSNRIIDLSKVSLAAPLSSSGATGNGESGGTTGETSESKESKKDMNDNLTDYLGGSQVDSHGNYIQQSDKGVTEFENEAYRDLRSFTELSPSDINNRVDKYYKSNNTPDNYRILSNMGATIASLAKEYKVDPRFIMAVMQCEFSFGKTGSNHLPKYNYGSIMTAGQQGYSGMHNFNSNLYINGVPGGQYGHNRILSAVKGNDGDEYSETNVNCKYTINTTAVKGALRNLFKFIGEVWFEDRQQYTLFDMQYGTYSYSGGHVDWINTIIGFMNEFAANETKDIIYCPPDEETLREFKTINGSNIDVDTLPDEGSASESFFELVKNLAKSIIGEDTWNTVTSLLNGEAFTGETASTLSDGTKLSSYLRDSKFKSARGFFSNIWKPSGSEENGVTSEFGPRLLNIYGKTVESEHYGIDLASSESNPNVLSPVSGTVINQPSNDKENDENGSYGNYVLVQDDSDNPKIHLFGHLKKDSVKVNEGDTVRRGKTILGKMGNSGCSSGDHLHYGVSNAPAKSGLVWQAYHTSLKSMMEDKAKNLGFSSKPSFDSNGWLDPDTYIANYEDEMGIGDGIETTTTDEDGNTTTSISSTSNNNKLTTVQDYIDKYPDAKDSILATTGLSEEEAATKKISDYPTPMQSAFFSSSNMKAIEARVAKENASKSTSSGEGSGKYSSLSDKLITNSKNVGGSEEPLRFTTSERALSKKLIQEAKARKESIKHPSGHYGMGGGSSDDELIKLNKTQAEFLATMTDTLTSIEAETKQRNEMIYAMLEAVQKGELSTDSSLYNTMMKSLRNSASSSSSGSSSYTSLNGDSDQTLVNTMISMVRQ
jgi:murein DD-endopeptidase MepM/ murein hydrolase activator NlpD